MDNYDHLFKVILVGSSGVGKSSLMTRYLDKTFSSNFISTIGVDFRQLTIHEGYQTIKLHLWDTAGQERFRTLTPTYYRGAQAVMICFSVNDPSSFQTVKRWYEQASRTVNNSDTYYLLVGLKSDLEPLVSDQEIASLQTELKLDYLSASAKFDLGVEQVFTKVVSGCLQKNKEIQARQASFPYYSHHGSREKIYEEEPLLGGFLKSFRNRSSKVSRDCCKV